jgi:hypothetical protein
VTVPGAGSLELAGKGVATEDAAAPAAGPLSLPVKPTGKTAKKLKKIGKAKVSVSVTFTPTGGTANTLTHTVKLKRKHG